MEQYFTRIDIQEADLRVTVESGVTWPQLIERLAEDGLALPILPLTSEGTVVEAVINGEHGGGSKHPNLAWYVSVIDFVDGSGKYCQRSKDYDEKFGEYVF
jgi:FAD/FMN-containing dehydrogenase